MAHLKNLPSVTLFLLFVGLGCKPDQWSLISDAEQDRQKLIDSNALYSGKCDWTLTKAAEQGLRTQHDFTDVTIPIGPVKVKNPWRRKEQSPSKAKSDYHAFLDNELVRMTLDTLSKATKSAVPHSNVTNDTAWEFAYCANPQGPLKKQDGNPYEPFVLPRAERRLIETNRLIETCYQIGTQELGFQRKSHHANEARLIFSVENFSGDWYPTVKVQPKLNDFSYKHDGERYISVVFRRKTKLKRHVPIFARTSFTVKKLLKTRIDTENHNLANDSVLQNMYKRDLNFGPGFNPEKNPIRHIGDLRDKILARSVGDLAEWDRIRFVGGHTFNAAVIIGLVMSGGGTLAIAAKMGASAAKMFLYVKGWSMIALAAKTFFGSLNTTQKLENMRSHCWIVSGVRGLMWIINIVAAVTIITDLRNGVTNFWNFARNNPADTLKVIVAGGAAADSLTRTRQTGWEEELRKRDLYDPFKDYVRVLWETEAISTFGQQEFAIYPDSAIKQQVENLIGDIAFRADNKGFRSEEEFSEYLSLELRLSIRNLMRPPAEQTLGLR